ncbi:hypothetical protein RIF29_14333 [Crotalaria pallida]|uniref:Uncharacterized protein n=1 Tax=Crotalaria pallida TaxID=3830 RepID=A0AAN9FBI2_CROPI
MLFRGDVFFADDDDLKVKYIEKRYKERSSSMKFKRLKAPEVLRHPHLKPYVSIFFVRLAGDLKKAMKDEKPIIIEATIVISLLSSVHLCIPLSHFDAHASYYDVGLKGEDLDLPSGNSRQWNSQSTLPKNQPLTWYKVTPSPLSNIPSLSFSSLPQLPYCEEENWSLLIHNCRSSELKREGTGLRRQWDFCELRILSRLFIKA